MYNQINLATAKITHHADSYRCSRVASASTFLLHLVFLRPTRRNIFKRLTRLVVNAGNGFLSLEVVNVSNKSKINNHRKAKSQLEGRTVDNSVCIFISVTFSCRFHWCCLVCLRLAACCIMKITDLEQFLLTSIICMVTFLWLLSVHNIKASREFHPNNDAKLDRGDQTNKQMSKCAEGQRFPLNVCPAKTR